jgi:hypothetical protein
MLMTYNFFWGMRAVGAVVLFIFAVWTVIYFARHTPQPTGRIACVVAAWALFPPIWFFLEYYGIDNGFVSNLPLPKDAELASIKDYADYASKIWAAVLASVLFLVKKP